GGGPRPAGPAQSRLFHEGGDRGGRQRQRLPPRFVAPALDPALVGARLGIAEVLGEHGGLFAVRLVRVAHYRYRFTRSGTFSGLTLSMKSSLISTGVANPHAPRHSTSITVHWPSRLVTPRSFAPVACRSARTPSSARRRWQGEVVRTPTQF